MANEWPTTKIGDVCLRVTKGTTPTTGGGAFTDRGIAFIKVEAITESGAFLLSVAFIDTETDEKLARSRLQEKDILFTIAGTIGRVAQVTNDILPANTNQAVAIVRPNPDLIFPRFLYYVLRDSKRIQLAQSRVVQSVQANFSLGELSAVELPLPPQEEQRAIAHILGTLDDRIELQPACKRNAGGDGPRLVQGVVRGLRTSARQDGRSLGAWPIAARPARAPLRPFSERGSPNRSWGRFRRGGRCSRSVNY